MMSASVPPSRPVRQVGEKAIKRNHPRRSVRAGDGSAGRRLLAEREVDLDLGDDLNRLPVQKCRLIAPLLDGVSSCLNQAGIDQFIDLLQVEHAAVAPDDRPQRDSPLDTLRLAVGRVHRSRRCVWRSPVRRPWDRSIQPE